MHPCSISMYMDTIDIQSILDHTEYYLYNCRSRMYDVLNNSGDKVNDLNSRATVSCLELYYSSHCVCCYYYVHENNS